MKNLGTIVSKKIKVYSPEGKLAHTTTVILALLQIKHRDVKTHSMRVALLAEKVAIEMKLDAKAAFFAGLLHDTGKLVLPYQLFDGHEISEKEYRMVKKHAVDGFKVLKKLHSFMALCSGLHHALSKRGYGLTKDDFPKRWKKETIEKVITISTLISICDFIDAFKNRKTKVKDARMNNCHNLRKLVKLKFPKLNKMSSLAINGYNELFQ